MNALTRKLLAEFFGVTVFVASIVGVSASGSPLGGPAAATTLGLMILATAGISGGHLNPAVSLYFLARREMSGVDFVSYVLAQLLGGVAGSLLGGVVWGQTALTIYTGKAAPAGGFAAEVLATAILVALVGHLAGRGQGSIIPAAVGLWVFAAGQFVSSGAFANPAVTFGRIFTPGSAGITMTDGAWYIVAQLVGTLLAVLMIGFVFPAKEKKAAKKK